MKPGRSLSARIAFKVGTLHTSMRGHPRFTPQDHAALCLMLNTERMSLLAGMLPGLCEHVDGGWITSFLGSGEDGLWLRIDADGRGWSVFSGARGSHHKTWVRGEDGCGVISLMGWLCRGQVMEPNELLRLLGLATLKVLEARSAALEDAA